MKSVCRAATLFCGTLAQYPVWDVFIVQLLPFFPQVSLLAVCQFCCVSVVHCEVALAEMYNTNARPSVLSSFLSWCLTQCEVVDCTCFGAFL